MYRLDLIGFGNQRITHYRTIDEARAAWKAARDEELPIKDDPTGFNYGRTTHWNLWELWKGTDLIASGEFEHYAQSQGEQAAVAFERLGERYASKAARATEEES